ncbi:MAG: Rv3235 family protein [Micromonosporaceae bacterium]
MTDDLPLAIKQFVDMYVEVLNQRRPLRHLLPHVSAEVFRGLDAELLRRSDDGWPPGRHGAGSARRTGRPATPLPLRAGPPSIRVRRVRACEPAPNAVEVAVVLARGEQIRALALRLERHLTRARWTCTALEFVA